MMVSLFLKALFETVLHPLFPEISQAQRKSVWPAPTSRQISDSIVSVLFQIEGILAILLLISQTDE